MKQERVRRRRLVAWVAAAAKKLLFHSVFLKDVFSNGVFH